jgi:DNA-binding IclR family transcriptional regulator
MNQHRANNPGYDKPPWKEETGGVRAVERAADILACLGKNDLGLSEISKEVGLNKATVFRMLVSLERKGFVTKNSNTGKYSLDWGLLGLLSDALNRNKGLVKCAHPYMEKLWEHTGETITLYIRKGFERLCIAELPSPHPLKYTVGIGVTVPLYAGSPGKLLLAYLHPAELEEVLNQIELIALTKRTITDKQKFLKELELIRKRGWATSFGERIEGVSSLSVPVTDRGNKVVASINILGPFIRVGEERLMGYLDMLKEVGCEISNRLVL